MQNVERFSNSPELNPEHAGVNQESFESEQYIDFGKIDLEAIYQGQMNIGEFLFWDEEKNEEAQRFLKKLVNFIEEKSISAERNSDEHHKLIHFLHKIKLAFFSFSPSLWSCLDFSDQIILQSKLEQFPEAKAYIAVSNYGEMAYNFSWADVGPDGKLGPIISSRLEELSDSEIIFTFSYLGNIARYAASNGTDFNIAQDNFEQIMITAGKNRPAFVKIALNIELHKLREVQSLENGETPATNLRRQSRNFLLSEHSKVLSSYQVNPDVVAREDERYFSAISSDSIALYESDMMTRFFAYTQQGQTDQKIEHFISYREINNEDSLNPLQSNPEDTPILMQQMHRPEMMQALNDILGINIQEVKLSSQIQLLCFLLNADEDVLQRMKNIIDEHLDLKMNFLNSFLACADDKDFGETLISIAEAANIDEVLKIFAKYMEIAGEAENVATFISNNTNHSESVSENTIANIVRSLLKRAKEVLIDFDRKATTGQALVDLEEARGDILLFAETLRTIKEAGGEISVDDFQKFHSETLLSDELSELQKTEMLKIMEQNYSASEHNDQSETMSKLRPMVLASLQEAFSNPDTEFQIVKYDDQIIGFMRFDRKDSQTLHAGSFNIRSYIRGSKIGSAALEASLEQKSRDCVILAEASPKLSITTRYIGPRFGFIASDIVEAGGTGEVGFEMERDDKINPHYQGFSQTPQNPVELAEAINSQPDQEIIELFFNLEEDYEKFIEYAKTMFRERDYVLTSYTRKGLTQGATFEKRIESTDINIAA